MLQNHTIVLQKIKILIIYSLPFVLPFYERIKIYFRDFCYITHNSKRYSYDFAEFTVCCYDIYPGISRKHEPTHVYKDMPLRLYKHMQNTFNLCFLGLFIMIRNDAIHASYFTTPNAIGETLDSINC